MLSCHLFTGLVFINPEVASLPTHAHLFGGPRCTFDSGDSIFECTGKDALPDQFLPVFRSPTPWYTIVQIIQTSLRPCSEPFACKCCCRLCSKCIDTVCLQGRRRRRCNDAAARFFLKKDIQGKRKAIQEPEVGTAGVVMVTQRGMAAAMCWMTSWSRRNSCVLSGRRASQPGMCSFKKLSKLESYHAETKMHSNEQGAVHMNAWQKVQPTKLRGEYLYARSGCDIVLGDPLEKDCTKLEARITRIDCVGSKGNKALRIMKDDSCNKRMHTIRNSCLPWQQCI